MNKSEISQVEAAEKLGCTVGYVRKLVAAGLIRVEKQTRSEPTPHVRTPCISAEELSLYEKDPTRRDLDGGPNSAGEAVRK